ncbi:hypothetical protein Mapa_017421 [Marchantia paleacea]|nr:hypothetical protein Mapa_017421 [Marchantia paleacea]
MCVSACYIKIAPWIFLELFDAAWGFLFDSLIIILLLVVIIISFLIHIYSIFYMSKDPHSCKTLAPL